MLFSDPSKNIALIIGVFESQSANFFGTVTNSKNISHFTSYFGAGNGRFAKFYFLQLTKFLCLPYLFIDKIAKSLCFETKNRLHWICGYAFLFSLPLIKALHNHINFISQDKNFDCLENHTHESIQALSDGAIYLFSLISISFIIFMILAYSFLKLNLVFKDTYLVLSGIIYLQIFFKCFNNFEKFKITSTSVLNLIFGLVFFALLIYSLMNLTSLRKIVRDASYVVLENIKCYFSAIFVASTVFTFQIALVFLFLLFKRVIEHEKRLAVMLETSNMLVFLAVAISTFFFYVISNFTAVFFTSSMISKNKLKRAEIYKILSRSIFIVHFFAFISTILQIAVFYLSYHITNSYNSSIVDFSVILITFKAVQILFGITDYIANLTLYKVGKKNSSDNTILDDEFYSRYCDVESSSFITHSKYLIFEVYFLISSIPRFGMSYHDMRLSSNIVCFKGLLIVLVLVFIASSIYFFVDSIRCATLISLNTCKNKEKKIDDVENGCETLHEEPKDCEFSVV